MNRSFLGKLGRQLGSRAAGIRSGILTLGAFTSGTYAAFQFDYRAGWGAVALSLLFLDWFWSAEKAPR